MFLQTDFFIFTVFCVMQAIQQWPQMQKMVKDAGEEEDADNGINLEIARKRLTEEDKFDKELYRQKIKEKHRVRFSIILFFLQDLMSVLEFCTGCND